MALLLLWPHSLSAHPAPGQVLKCPLSVSILCAPGSLGLHPCHTTGSYTCEHAQQECACGARGGGAYGTVPACGHWNITRPTHVFSDMQCSRSRKERKVLAAVGAACLHTFTGCCGGGRASTGENILTLILTLTPHTHAPFVCSTEPARPGCRKQQGPYPSTMVSMLFAVWARKYGGLGRNVVMIVL